MKTRSGGDAAILRSIDMLGRPFPKTVPPRNDDEYLQSINLCDAAFLDQEAQQGLNTSFVLELSRPVKRAKARRKVR